MEFSESEIHASPLSHFISDVLSRHDAEDYGFLVWSLLFFDRFREDEIRPLTKEHELTLIAIRGLTDIGYLDPEEFIRNGFVYRLEEIANMLNRDLISEDPQINLGIEVIRSLVDEIRFFASIVGPSPLTFVDTVNQISSEEV